MRNYFLTRKKLVQILKFKIIIHSAAAMPQQFVINPEIEL